MKRISILKVLVTIAFIISAVTVAFGVPFTLIFLIAPDRIPGRLATNISDNHLLGFGAVVYLVLSLGATAALAYALSQFKQCLTFFEKRVIFDNRTVALLQKSGKALLVAALLTVSAEFASSIFANAEPHINVSFTFGPTLILGALGLLFLVLADVFNAARKLKEENDLTV